MKKFNLSDERKHGLYDYYYYEKKVKEAVRRLKEKLDAKAIGSTYAEEEIDKIFGDKLK